MIMIILITMIITHFQSSAEDFCPLLFYKAQRSSIDEGFPG
jgi:hypothetical protein